MTSTSSSRASILQDVRAATATAIPLPDLSALAAVSPEASADALTATLDLIGARWVRGAELADAIAWVEAHVPAGAAIASSVPGLTGNIDLAAVNDPHQLDGIHTAIVPGRFAVCENGAVWLDESALGPHRVLPFIAEHLVIVLSAREIVPTMHQAYARLKAPESAFGVFLAGPSKTADIEQCLVVGAHGARSCTVFLIG